MQEKDDENKGADKKVKPTIEQLGKGLDPAVFAGVCAAKGWRKGKVVSEAVFKKAVTDFSTGAITGKDRETKKGAVK